jgi:voltage-gated potassium channel
MMNKTSLNIIINGTEKKASRVFTLVIHGLILLSAILFSIETLPNLSPRTRHILYIADVVTVLIFTAEYALRVYAAPRKAAFIFSFFGILDLLSFLPFYLGTGIDLRSIRIFRLLRLFRIFKLPHFIGRY